MSEFKKEMPHWTTVCSLVQLIINMLMLSRFFDQASSESASEQRWLYFAIANLLTFGSIILNIAFERDNLVRSSLGVASIFIYTYILPMTILTSDYTPEYGLLSGMIYVMLIICVSPVQVSIAAFINGAIFAWQFHNFSEVPIDTIYKPLLAYLALTGVAVLWRALFLRLIIGYLHLTRKDPGKESLYESRINELEEERNLLRSEIITHVVELNEAVLRHHADEQEGK
jgi:hypothetical protein